MPEAQGATAGEAAAGPAEARPRRAEKAVQAPRPVELHSGHRLARRYRLEECITRLDGFSSWRAVDEKLRRAVGVHVLPAGHERASAVLSAARATALLGDPRFVQVLDAVEESRQVYVVHEWLADATPLSTVLATGPLDPHEAQAMATQVAQAMAAAHRKDLAHLRLTPATVLRTGPGQFRIRGLAVDAALRGITADNPRRTDTEAIGALLYAALTQRWPYPEGAHGLQGVAGLSKGSRNFLAAPEQVRAGVHRGLSELAMRALVNEGATAASQKPPYTTPQELAEALAAMPRIRPSAPTPTALAGFQPTTYQRGTLGPSRPAAPVRVPAAAAPALPGRTGTVLKWGVSALLIAALGLGSWQLADALLKGDGSGKTTEQTSPSPEPSQPPPATGPIAVQDSIEFDPESTLGGQNPELVGNVIDGDPDTDWHTKSFYGPHFGNYRSGLGIILDLGETQEVGSVTVNAVGDTPMELRAAPADATEPPGDPDDFEVLASGSGETVTLSAEEPVETRFVLVWLTDLPQSDDGQYRGRITDITVSH
ncbi:protein kinase family protein [Streptomyces hoynatensis]|uniref:Serine/threonine protein kinase n=1 Tax=Streptomyces hoynatensis TaxID=1141874 RepID=A0A3A9YLP0_9ACTN|nr:protein kinase family protein [Streptomyces hoynatensis]RKN36034.1 serine/threonine protein kinase [Streptomyces hoynatensis]